MERRRFAQWLAVGVMLMTSVAAQDTRITLPGHVGSATGRPGAPVVLVEFTDVECPNCREFHREVFERLKQEYIETGQVLFIHRDLPLPNHPNTIAAAHGMRCAGDQAAFWPVRHALLSNDKLSPEIVELAARLAGVELGEFRRCMQDGRHLAAIDRDMTDAKAAKISVTPTFVLGKFVPQGIEGVLIEGSPTFAELDTRIKALLKAGSQD
jgi:protein-disulfide isomerase